MASDPACLLGMLLKDKMRGLFGVAVPPVFHTVFHRGGA